MTVDRKPKGLFLNSIRSQCSIFESGKMFFEAIKRSNRFLLDYQEINRENHRISDSYDFFLFNYHHATMSWLDTRGLRKILPGAKITLVLETTPNYPFALCPPDDFDAYCVLDPSMDVPDARVYPFPRPLEIVTDLPPYPNPEIPVIGTFGFATPGKGFELVIDAVNREFKDAVVRVNIPPGTYADHFSWNFQKRNYGEYLGELCKKVARPGVRVVVTHQYMTKTELIKWCSRNTLNCFLYNRNQPGLSATTDQAISSGRPLAVSGNETFRHIHPYVDPYPIWSLKESIDRSAEPLSRMKRDWSPRKSAEQFEKILEDFRILPKAPEKSQKLSRIGSSVRVLFVSHKEKQCGIYQYGASLREVFSKSLRYSFVYEECSSAEELRRVVFKTKPAAVIYNYYPATMGWLSGDITRRFPIPQAGIMHEVTQEESDRATQELFDYHLCPDPTLEVKNPFVIKTRRLIPPYINMKNSPSEMTIGSFGFGFRDKGFTRLVESVQNEFDHARIVLHLPFNDVIDPNGERHALITARRCRDAVTKPGIKLEIRHEFLTKANLLDFLAGNSINAFFYDTEKNRGISSVIEHALAVQRPIAITKCGMFRHVFQATPSICIENSTLKEIADNGIAPLVPFYNEWSEAAFLSDYERIVDTLVNYCGRNTKLEPSGTIEKNAGEEEPSYGADSEDCELPAVGAFIPEQKNPGTLHELGVASFRKGEYELAADCFLKIISTNPDFPPAHNNLGVVLNQMGRREEAKLYYEMAIALKPDYAEAFHNLAMLLKNQGAVKDACSHARKAVDLNPDYAEARRNLEEIEMILGGNPV